MTVNQMCASCMIYRSDESFQYTTIDSQLTQPNTDAVQALHACSYVPCSAFRYPSSHVHDAQMMLHVRRSDPMICSISRSVGRVEVCAHSHILSNDMCNG